MAKASSTACQNVSPISDAERSAGIRRESRPSFAESLARGRAGDGASLELLLDHHLRCLDREALRLIGNRLRALVDSSDLLQSTRIILWLGLRDGKWRVSSEGHWLALARAILRRQAARRCRTWQTESNRRTDEIKLPATRIDLPATNPSKQDPGADAEFEDAVRHVLAGFDDVDRELIRLRLLDHSTADVARILNLSAASLRVRLGRLRKRLLESRALHRTLGGHESPPPEIPEPCIARFT